MKKQKEKIQITQLLMPIHIISSQVDSIIEFELKKKFNVSFSDFNILRTVLVLGSCTQSELARNNLVTEAAISKKITPLLSKKMIKRKTDKKDSRKKILALTSRGKIKMEKMQKHIMEKMEDVFREVDSDKCHLSFLLNNMLNEVIKHSPNKKILLNSTGVFANQK
jgi:DNA-binding MarR family transcriptional regulator